MTKPLLGTAEELSKFIYNLRKNVKVLIDASDSSYEYNKKKWLNALGRDDAETKRYAELMGKNAEKAGALDWFENELYKI